MINQKIDLFFKRKTVGRNDESQASTCKGDDANTSNDQKSPSVESQKSPSVESLKEDTNHFERDPGLRKSIWEYPPEQRDEVRRYYISVGPFQPRVSEDKRYNGRIFKEEWYKPFKNWLEFSPSKNAAFCLPCFLFIKPGGRFGASAFTVDGFRNWKKVNDGKNCVFVNHVGDDPNSLHKQAMQSYYCLQNSLQHLDNIVEKHTSEQVTKNRLQLQVSMDVAKWCAFQAVGFRGNDESAESSNRGNFIELIKLLASYSKDVADVVLENAPKNAQYSSPLIQKEILSIYSRKVQNYIREEIGDQPFSILVDESRDSSRKQQMAIILRFVDSGGYIQERFFDLISVPDTRAICLKNLICDVFSQHNLSLLNLRGQGYDGASNMRGEFNGLQALFLQECQCAYYIHCFAHRLQLTLVAAASEVIPVEQFFTNLTLITVCVTSSCKRVDQLKASKAARIAEMIAVDDIETGRGKNQIGTLKRSGSTRWGSYLASICSLFNLYEDTCSVLIDIINDGSSSTQRSEADALYDIMTSFEFVFILHLMRDVLGYADILCQALQCKSQDILNAMDLVSVTKVQLQKYRDDCWDQLLSNVKQFCSTKNINIPDMNALYTSGRGRARKQKNHVTIEHHYRVEVFLVVLDVHLQELNTRFKEDVTELLTLSSALDPRDGFKAFNIKEICQLASKFYPMDFTAQDLFHLKIELELFYLDARQNFRLQNLKSLPELCQMLAKSGKATSYNLLDKLIRLILTLPVSTATTERAFSVMKIIKTDLRNRMECDFLASTMILYIEKEIAQKFDIDSVIDDFVKMKKRRVQFHMPKIHP